MWTNCRRESQREKKSHQTNWPPNTPAIRRARKSWVVADEPGIPIDRNQRRSPRSTPRRRWANREESRRYDEERNVPGRNQAGATTPPALPRDIGDAVVGIDGLQPWAHAIKHPVLRDKTSPPARSRRKPASATSYKIYDILKAYDAHGLEVPGKGLVTGKGQTIAILIDTLPLKSDVQAFWQRSGLSIDQSQLQLINVRGRNAKLPAAWMRKHWMFNGRAASRPARPFASMRRARSTIPIWTKRST